MTDDPLAERQRLEDKVEKEFDRLKLFMALAWREHPQFVQMLADRLAVEGLTGDLSRHRRQVYRAIHDYMEDALEERADADLQRERRREGRRGYLRRLFEGDSED